MPRNNPMDLMLSHLEPYAALPPEGAADVNKLITTIAAIDLKSASIDTVRDTLKGLLDHYLVVHMMPPVGTTIFRARKMTGKPTSISELSYPPSRSVTFDGRLNRAGQSMFYASVLRSGACFEVRPVQGEMIAVSSWSLQAPLILLWIGFSQEVFKRIGANRTDEYVDTYDKFVKRNASLGIRHDFVAHAFTQDVQRGAEELYKISIALAECFSAFNVEELMAKYISAGAEVTEPRVAGFMYPTLAMSGNADNIALYPSFVDRYLRPESVEWATIMNTPVGLKFSLGIIDVADEFAPDGSIRWKRGVG